MSLDAIGLVSKDVHRTIQFYEILGVDLKEFGGKGHYEATTESGVRIMVDTIELMREINPSWEEAVGSGIVLCFKQDKVIKVNNLHSNIVESGFKSIKEPWDAFWGQRYSSVQDPNGYQIDIFADL